MRRPQDREKLTAKVLLLALLAAVLGAVIGALMSVTFGDRARAAEPAAVEVLEPLRIMPLGDSITKGTGGPGLNGYRAKLRSYLQANNFPVDYVGSQKWGNQGDLQNEGHGGWQTSHILANIDAWMARYRPDIVLLQAGTNDMAHEVDPEHAAANLAEIIARIHAAHPEADVYVAKITGTRLSERNALNKAYNDLIPGVVATEREVNANTYLVDMSPVKASLALYDNVHPNAMGYDQMAYRWYNALRSTQLGGNAWRVVMDPKWTKKYQLCFRQYPGVTAKCSTYVRHYRSGTNTWKKS